MSLENFTTYTEVDPQSTITINSATSVTGALSRAGDPTYLYRDLGAAYFSGDYSHTFEVTFNSYVASSGSGFMGIADAIGDRTAIEGNSDSMIMCLFGNAAKVTLYEVDSGTGYTDQYVATTATKYYCTFVRDESVGTFGTAYLYIYSDAAKTNLLDTLLVTLHTSKKDFQYVYAAQNFDTNLGVVASYTLEDLDLGISTGIWRYLFPQDCGFIQHLSRRIGAREV